MTDKEKEVQEEKDMIVEMEQEINEIENEEWQIDEEKLEEAQNPEEYKCRDMLAKVSADFDNYKKRVERDKLEISYFTKFFYEFLFKKWYFKKNIT